MSCEKTFARFLLHILYLLFRRFRCRIFKEFLFFRHFQYFSLIHEDHLIGNSLCLSQIMCDDDESILVYQLQKRFFDCNCILHIQCGARLVKEQDLRTGSEASCDSKTLLLTAG